ncbi:MAG: HD domain-containing protein [Bdellovibrionota bacterium]|nr:HD domain-containing protein [Bdellovibrionota bacterium]
MISVAFVFATNAYALNCKTVLSKYKVYQAKSFPIPSKISNQANALKRTGWLDHKIPKSKAESVWQHTKKLEKAALILFSKAKEETRNRAGLVALVHDLGEVIAGDFTPFDNITKEEKHQLEKKAIETLAPQFAENQGRLLQLWLEYELQTSAISPYLKDLDKIDAAIQAMVYLKQGYKVESFLDYAKQVIKTPELRRVYDDILMEFSRDKNISPYRVYYKALEDISVHFSAF